jgi:hypothetical protein
MESLFKDLLKYKLKNLYSGAKSRKDNRLNTGFDYSSSLMQNNLARHILRNQTLIDFVSFINDYLSQLINAVKNLQQWKNYTVKKDDNNVR